MTITSELIEITELKSELAEAKGTIERLDIENEHLRRAARQPNSWLIETGDHKYWNGEARLGKPMLTANPNEAVRFARQGDANLVIYHLFEEYSGFLVAREHGWI